jgi:hypothetical protein
MLEIFHEKLLGNLLVAKKSSPLTLTLSPRGERGGIRTEFLAVGPATAIHLLDVI